MKCHFSVLTCVPRVSHIDGQDYESTEGIVTFYPGMSMSTPFTINLRDNAVPEGAEEFKIQIEVENPWNSRVKLLQSETTVTIKDDDCESCV